MDSPSQNARLEARQAQQRHEHKRKLAHGRVAALLQDPSAAPKVVAYANDQVAKWQLLSLCSRDYIEDWQNLLRDPLAAAKLLLEDSPRAVRLRQNTPFAAYLSA